MFASCAQRLLAARFWRWWISLVAFFLFAIGATFVLAALLFAFIAAAVLSSQYV